MDRIEAIDTLLKKVKTLDDFRDLSSTQMEILLTSKERPDIPAADMVKSLIVAKMTELEQRSLVEGETMLIKRDLERNGQYLNAGQTGLMNYALDQAITHDHYIRMMGAAEEIGGEFSDGDKLIARYTEARENWLEIAIEIEKSQPNPQQYTGSLKRD